MINLKISSNLIEKMRKTLPTEALIKTKIERSFNVLGSLMEDEVKDYMRNGSGNHTGRTYFYPQWGYYHIASAPGEPLANVTGDTSRSITYMVSGYEMVFGGNTQQLLYWEKLAPINKQRPTLVEAIRKFKPAFKSYYVSIV